MAMTVCTPKLRATFVYVWSVWYVWSVSVWYAWVHVCPPQSEVCKVVYGVANRDKKQGL